MTNKIYVTDRMIELRKDFPMTQKQLASMLTMLGPKKVSLSMVQKWEQRDRPIGADKINILANLFKVGPSVIGERRDAK